MADKSYEVAGQRFQGKEISGDLYAHSVDINGGTIDTVTGATITAGTLTLLQGGTIDTLSALTAGTVTLLQGGTVDTMTALVGGTVNAGGFTTTVSQTPTVGTVIYATGDAVGGTLTFANAVRASGSTGMIQSVIIIDDDKESVEFDLVLFDQAFTATADNAAFDPTDADMQNSIGHINIATTDYADFTDNSMATVTDGNLPLSFTANATSIFGQLVVRGAPTYTAADDLTVKINILQD